MGLINFVLSTLSKSGGMPRYMAELAENLAQQGYYINVYCLKWDKKTLIDNDHVNIYCYRWLKHFPKVFKYAIFAYLMKRVYKHKDAVTISSTRLFKTDVAIVGGTHLAFIQRMKNGKKSLYDRLEIHLEKSSYQSAKAIIAHSPLMVQEISSYKLDTEHKTHMLFAPVSLSQFKYIEKDEKPALKQKLNLPLDKTILFAIGTEKPTKGVPKIISALKKMSDRDHYFLVIAGKHYNAPLPDNAQFVGSVSNIEDYYGAADITIVASEYEAFGLVVVESLQVGTPVITSDCVGANILLNEGNSIILSENNDVGIMNALNQAKHTEFACSKNFISEAQLDWDSHVKKMIPIIENISRQKK